MTNINITYLRSRARELRQAHTETEFQEQLEKLSSHLNITKAGESLTKEHQERVFRTLRSLGISAYRTTSA